MSEKVLVITEDSSSMSGISGRWTRCAYRIYRFIYHVQLVLLLRRLRKKKVVLLTWQDVINKGLRHRHLRYLAFDTEVSEMLETAHHKLCDEAWRFVEDWPRLADLEKELDYKGVSLMDMQGVETATFIYREVLNYIEVVKRVIEREKPEFIYLVSGQSQVEKVALHLAGEFGIPLKIFCPFNITLLNNMAGNYYAKRRERRKLLKLQEDARQLTFCRQRIQESEHPTVLIVGNHGEDAMFISPLVRRLKDEGRSEPYVVASVTGSSPVDESLKTLQAEGIRTDYALAYLSGQETRTLVQENGLRLKMLWERTRTRPDMVYRLIYESVPLFNLFEKHLGYMVTFAFLEATIYIEAALRIFRQMNPSLVVIGSDTRCFQRACAYLARARGIPTLLIRPQIWSSLQRGPNRWDCADQVAVVGEESKDCLLKWVKPDQIHICGAPRFDFLAQPEATFSRKKICQKLKLDANKKIIVLVSSYTTEYITLAEKRLFFTSVYKAANHFDDAQLVVKAHPNEDFALLQRHVAEWGIDQAVVVEGDLYALLYASHLVVTLFSATGFEAMLLGRPVIVVDLLNKGYEHYVPYTSGGGALGVYDEDELLPCLKLLLEDEAAREKWIANGYVLVHRYVRPLDGHAMDRLAGLVRHMIEGKEAKE